MQLFEVGTHLPALQGAEVPAAVSTHPPHHLLHTPFRTPAYTQVTIAGGVGHYAVKKLAYDLCKAVPLLPSDYSLLVDGIKVCQQLVCTWFWRCGVSEFPAFPSCLTP